MSKEIAGFLIVLALAVGAAAWWWLLRAPAEARCDVCTRHIHQGMDVSYTAAGESKTACCPACVFTYGRQTGKQVEIRQVTDYLSGQRLKPEEASFVVGSDEHPCSHAEVLVPEPGQRLPIHYDRCLPSVLAFRQADQARDFAKQHGGVVENWSRVVAELRREEKK